MMCPWEIALPSLPQMVCQGAAVSSKRFISVSSAWKCSGTERLAAPSGLSRSARVVVLCQASASSHLMAVTRVREGRSPTVKQFQRLLGLMASVSNVISFGLLYMRPPQWLLKSKVFSSRGNQRRMLKVTQRCLRALDMWRKPWFLSQGLVLGAPCRCVMLVTDASLTGWGAVMSGRSARGLWSGHHLS